jgi:hypothetical protein
MAFCHETPKWFFVMGLPNGFLSWDSQMAFCPEIPKWESPKLPRLGVPQLCGTIISSVDLQSGRGLNQSCIICRELSNKMLHTTCMQGNRVDSQLHVVGSQTASLAI